MIFLRLADTSSGKGEVRPLEWSAAFDFAEI